jgi:DNA-binding SARP family transcriptional activator
MLELQLFGQFTIKIDGSPVTLPSRSAQSLLAYLALTKGEYHRREKLAGVLWPDSSEVNARRYLRQALWRIRRTIEPTPEARGLYIQTDTIHVALDPRGDIQLDVTELESDLSELGEFESLQSAVSVYSRHLLEGFQDEWVGLE